jgi:tetratricopeptide (TPR) repeat protein
MNICLSRFASGLISLASLVSVATAFAQSQPFALPSHKGAITLDLEGFHITQATAKPNGNELGIRAHDDGHTELLAFLFLTPENTSQTAASCRQAELDQIRKDSAGQTKLQTLNPNGKDTKEIATMSLTYPGGESLYQYSGSGDQCFTVEVYADKGNTLDRAQASALLSRQHYDPQHVPSGKDKFVYAGVLYRTGQYMASVPVYADFLASTSNSMETLSARRIAIDNMGMSLGMSGKIDDARKVFNHAIQEDPKYPLNYYNLACADAEQGYAADAKLHLRQAFDRKANLIPGESLPDPTKDDSILKLKNNKDFWAFVQTLE